MTEIDARHHLKDLWQEGEIPNNFTDGHSDYDKAIQYTITNGEFNYEKFYEEISIIKFGFWQIEPDALVAKEDYDYIIGCNRFWETRDFNGHLVWDWLIHLVEKSWITKENVKDLNTAFFFCQDYFKTQKPVNVPYVSTAQTLYIQKQLLDIREEMDRYIRSLKGSTAETNKDVMRKYYDLTNNIQYL